jgi:hypothetical protein
MAAATAARGRMRRRRPAEGAEAAKHVGTPPTRGRGFCWPSAERGTMMAAHLVPCLLPMPLHLRSTAYTGTAAAASKKLLVLLMLRAAKCGRAHTIDARAAVNAACCSKLGGSQLQAGVRGGWRSALSSSRRERLQARVCRVTVPVCTSRGTRCVCCADVHVRRDFTERRVTEIALAVPVLG